MCHKRKVYDRGNGATVLLYDHHKQATVLVRQLRVATWINGDHDGMLIKTYAGLLDNDEPEACIRKEAVREIGYEVDGVHKLFELFMSPGGVTEVVHFSVTERSDAQRITSDGGVDDEVIEVLELPFNQALQMVADGETRDGKTIVLLQYLQTSGPMSGDSDGSD